MSDDARQLPSNERNYLEFLKAAASDPDDFDAQNIRKAIAEIERARMALEWIKRHADGLSATWHVADIALQTVHASDCALNNAPALPVGPCDCEPTSSHETSAQVTLDKVRKWSDDWSRPLHSDASEADRGWYWAAQEVQNLLDPNPESAQKASARCTCYEDEHDSDCGTDACCGKCTGSQENGRDES